MQASRSREASSQGDVALGGDWCWLTAKPLQEASCLLCCLT